MADINHRVLKPMTEITKSCLLPELKDKFTSQYLDLDSSHFNEFRHELDENLKALFHLIQQNEEILSDQSTETLEFRKFFVILCCEQTTECTLYQTKNESCVKHLIKFSENRFEKFAVRNDILDGAFQYYKEKLVKDVWKRNIGAVHGFSRFCEVSFFSFFPFANAETLTFGRNSRSRR